jgi:hypothetical protein
MPNSQTSDFRRRLRREIAGYFIVIMCALPIRLWLMANYQGIDEGFGAVWPYLHCLSLGFFVAVLRSKLPLRTKLILTGLLVAL